MKRLLIILLLFVNYLNNFGQGEIDNQERALFFNETSFGVSLTSTGYGVDFRHAKNINYFKKTLYAVSLTEIKHPKETKSVGQGYIINRNFVYGKLNNFYQLRLSYGKQNELFSERDKGSLSIRLIYTAGLNIGILKPIYYEYREYDQTSDVTRTVYSKFTDSHSLFLITRANYFMGIDETKVVPGITARSGFTFEFGSNVQKLQALEAGVILDAFPKKIPIMQSTNNSFAFFSLYINYRIGFVRQQYEVDPDSAIDILFSD